MGIQEAVMPVIPLDACVQECGECAEKDKRIESLESAVAAMYGRIAELEGRDAARAEFGPAMRILGMEET